MNKDSGELDYGELFDELFYFKEVVWKIPNVLSLPNLVDYKVQSPSFPFASATWKLSMYPYGETYNKTEGFINLDLNRISSDVPEHHVFLKVFFKTRHGKEFESFTHTDTLGSEFCTLTVQRKIEKSQLIKKQHVIAPNGDLTVVYQIRIKKIACINTHSQTETTTSLLMSPADKLVEDFKELFLKQEDCDVVIKVKGQEFKAHKIILSARCPVFSSTFRNEMKEKATGVVDIEDCDPSSFSDFLCFLYCGKIKNLTAENAFSLFTTADKYDVQDLRSKCLEFMKKNLLVDTFCETVTVALQHLESELLDLATDFFAKHLQEIIVTVKWQRFVIENPVQGNEIMIKSLVPNKK